MFTAFFLDFVMLEFVFGFHKFNKHFFRQLGLPGDFDCGRAEGLLGGLVGWLLVLFLSCLFV